MSASLVLDALLVLLLLAQLVAGYREGLVVGLLSLVGLVGGALLGIAVLPGVVAGWSAGLERTLVVVVGTIALALLGRLLLGVVGLWVRRRVAWRPARAADALLGAVAGLLSTLLVVWVVAGAARAAPVASIASAVTGSTVVSTLDRVVPAQTGGVLSRFWAAAEASGFPRVFDGVDPEPILPVRAPASTVPDTAGLRAAQPGIVKVTGVASSCDRGLEGSGFVAARRGGAARVVTNAHVVAGVQSPSVQPQGTGRRYPATVVAYDPALDLAVLDVPGLDADALPRAEQLDGGDAAVVAGFPLDGPYTLATARVRSVLQAQGRDIYDQATVVRDVYSVYTTVEPGNSGGPLLTEDGAVAGVVFARSLDDPVTGYALTPGELDDVLTAAGDSTAAVSTGACAAE
ncbi:MarP family serine protease [Kineococcus rubinsiae]|uniref:MarP family serine protease n=1 Tax=Kineococcus rubinsiae TaxID=2609562 RepID=UPI00143134C8|nr:MarP family serine protease [Kineococcus rubinsiae]